MARKTTRQKSSKTMLNKSQKRHKPESFRKYFNWNTVILLAGIVTILWLFGTALQSMINNKPILGPVGSISWKELSGTRETHLTRPNSNCVMTIF